MGRDKQTSFFRSLSSQRGRKKTRDDGIFNHSSPNTISSPTGTGKYAINLIRSPHSHSLHENTTDLPDHLMVRRNCETVHTTDRRRRLSRSVSDMPKLPFAVTSDRTKVSSQSQSIPLPNGTLRRRRKMNLSTTTRSSSDQIQEGPEKNHPPPKISDHLMVRSNSDTVHTTYTLMDRLSRSVGDRPCCVDPSRLGSQKKNSLILVDEKDKKSYRRLSGKVPSAGSGATDAPSPPTTKPEHQFVMASDVDDITQQYREVTKKSISPELGNETSSTLSDTRSTTKSQHQFVMASEVDYIAQQYREVTKKSISPVLGIETSNTLSDTRSASVSPRIIIPKIPQRLPPPPPRLHPRGQHPKEHVSSPQWTRKVMSETITKVASNRSLAPRINQRDANADSSMSPFAVRDKVTLYPPPPKNASRGGFKVKTRSPTRPSRARVAWSEQRTAQETNSSAVASFSGKPPGSPRRRRARSQSVSSPCVSKCRTMQSGVLSPFAQAQFSPAQAAVSSTTSTSKQVNVHSTSAQSNHQSSFHAWASMPTPQTLQKTKYGVREPHGVDAYYELGETLHHLSHMTVESTVEASMASIQSLRNHDFCFLKRSDGSYTYATLAHRTMEMKRCSTASTEREREDDTEECMTFVVSGTGCTKMIKKRQWVEFVKRVSPHLSKSHNNDKTLSESVSSNRSIDVNKMRQEFYSTHPPLEEKRILLSVIPPLNIALSSVEDDGVSVISDVSYMITGNGCERREFVHSQPVILE